MSITISFDPTDESDLEYIRAIVNGEEPEAVETPVPKKAAKKAAAPVEPEEEGTDGPTMEQAVEKATELVTEGRAADVKGALATFGVKRVTELDESKLGEFLALLDEESVV